MNAIQSLEAMLADIFGSSLKSKAEEARANPVAHTETRDSKRGKRTGHIGWKTKREAIEHARTRYYDAKKPKAERFYVLPTSAT